MPFPCGRSGINPQHTYATEGTYIVILTVSDGYGGVDTSSNTVIIPDDDVSPPEVEYHYSGDGTVKDVGILTFMATDDSGIDMTHDPTITYDSVSDRYSVEVDLDDTIINAEQTFSYTFWDADKDRLNPHPDDAAYVEDQSYSLAEWSITLYEDVIDPVIDFAFTPMYPDSNEPPSYITVTITEDTPITSILLREDGGSPVVIDETYEFFTGSLDVSIDPVETENQDGLYIASFDIPVPHPLGDHTYEIEVVDHYDNIAPFEDNQISFDVYDDDVNAPHMIIFKDDYPNDQPLYVLPDSRGNDWILIYATDFDEGGDDSGLAVNPMGYYFLDYAYNLPNANSYNPFLYDPSDPLNTQYDFTWTAVDNDDDRWELGENIDDLSTTVETSIRFYDEDTTAPIIDYPYGIIPTKDNHAHGWLTIQMYIYDHSGISSAILTYNGKSYNPSINIGDVYHFQIPEEDLVWIIGEQEFTISAIDNDKDRFFDVIEDGQGYREAEGDYWIDMTGCVESFIFMIEDGEIDWMSINPFENVYSLEVGQILLEELDSEELNYRGERGRTDPYYIYDTGIQAIEVWSMEHYDVLTDPKIREINHRIIEFIFSNVDLKNTIINDLTELGTSVDILNTLELVEAESYSDAIINLESIKIGLTDPDEIAKCDALIYWLEYLIVLQPHVPYMIDSPEDMTIEEGVFPHDLTWTIGDADNDPLYYHIFAFQMIDSEKTLVALSLEEEWNVGEEIVLPFGIHGGISEGEYSVEIWAYDDNLNLVIDEVMVSVFADITPPTVEIIPPLPEYLLIGEYAQWELVVRDSGTGVAYQKAMLNDITIMNGAFRPLPEYIQPFDSTLIFPDMLGDYTLELWVGDDLYVSNEMVIAKLNTYMYYIDQSVIDVAVAYIEANDYPNALDTIENEIIPELINNDFIYNAYKLMDQINILTDLIALGELESHNALHLTFFTHTIHRVEPDITAPIVSSPEDITCDYGTSGNSITWTITDDRELSSYSITRDGIEIDSGILSGAEALISINIDGLEVGQYIFEITATDSNDNFATDSVSVESEVVTCELIEDLKQYLIALPSEYWRHPEDNRLNAMLNKLDTLMEMCELGDYDELYDKLIHDIKPKLTGEKANGKTFKNAWIEDEATQNDLKNIINDIIKSIPTI